MKTDLHATKIKGGDSSKSLLCSPMDGTTAKLCFGRSLLTLSGLVPLIQRTKKVVLGP